MALAPLDDVVAAIRRDPSRSAVCCDFDGTLAPIVDDPAASEPLDGVAAVLDDLAARYAVVAVLSGRPVAFLQNHLPPTVQLHGLYGLEFARDGLRHDHPSAGAWRDAVEDVTVASVSGAPAGVLVEPKGVSLTLHYRSRPELADEVLAFAEAQAARAGLAVRTARMSVELHPPLPVDKGSVLREIASGMSAVCFMGDDTGDLPAFAALDDLAALGVAAVRIAVSSPEAPADLLARADAVVAGPEGALALLRSL